MEMRKISIKDWCDIAKIEKLPKESPRAGKYVGMATEKQKDFLHRNHICHTGLSCYQASIIVGSVIKRSKEGLADPEQLLALLKKGHFPKKLRRTTTKTAINLLLKW